MNNILDFFKILSYDEVKDYGRNQTNRMTNAKHVNDFKNEVINRGLQMGLPFGLCPVIINPITRHILDGQHKHKAFIELIEENKIPADTKILVGIWPVEKEEDERDLIIRLNSKTKNWSLNDYLDSYAKTNEYYAKLKEFCETHTLCYTVNADASKKVFYRYGAAIIKGKSCSGCLKKECFEFTNDELKIADNIHEELVKIREKLGITKDSGIEPMAIEWHEFRDMMSIDDILNLKIPDAILKLEKKNRDNWDTIFSRLNAEITKSKKKQAA